MKTKLFTVVPMILLSLASFGQPPHIVSIDITPLNPTPLDTIYVITTATTAENGVYLGNDVYHYGTNIKMEGCYFSGSEASVTDTYTDTVEIGTKNTGTYTLTYKAYLSGHDMICNEHLDSNEMTKTFSVGYLSIDATGLPSQPQVFPNPSYDGMFYVRIENPIEVINYKVYNTLGELVVEGTPNSTGAIDLTPYSGMFFIQIQSGDAITSRKIEILR